MKDQMLEQTWNMLIKQEGYSVNDKVCIRRDAAMRMLAGLAEYGYKYSNNKECCPQEVTEEDFYKLYEQKQQLQINKLLENEVSFEISRVQITHAIDSGDFAPANDDYNNWLDFWKGHVSDSIKAKFLKGIKNPVGAHVIDKDCKVYIMPCDKDENLEEGQIGAQKSKKLFLSVPKDALVEITENDSKGKGINSISWSEFIKRNKSFSLLMQDMKESDFQKRW